MSALLQFDPDPQRAAALDAGMRGELAASLRYIAAEADGAIPFDMTGVERVCRALDEGQRFSPYLFGSYYQLVLALLDGEDAQAERLLARICRLEPIAERFRIAPLGEGPSAAYAEDYVAMMCADASIDLNFLPPAAEKAAAFIERLHAAVALMERAAPSAIGEIRAIVDEVVIVSGDPSRKMQFDGGSHYQLWGALFLNCDFHPNAVAAAEVLAHESAHSFLFGCCRDEMLVENDDEETYVSPLRPDPRPMDGIYHATFVSARMHWLMSRLIASGVLSAEERAYAEDAREADARNFASGFAVVEAHGRLTRTGAALMRNAQLYMTKAA